MDRHKHDVSVRGEERPIRHAAIPFNYNTIENSHKGRRSNHSLNKRQLFQANSHTGKNRKHRPTPQERNNAYKQKALAGQKRNNAYKQKALAGQKREAYNSEKTEESTSCAYTPEKFELQIKGLPPWLQNSKSVVSIGASEGVAVGARIVVGSHGSRSRSDRRDKVAYLQMASSAECIKVAQKLDGSVLPGCKEPLRVKMVEQETKNPLFTRTNLPKLSQELHAQPQASQGGQLATLVKQLNQALGKPQGELHQQQSFLSGASRSSLSQFRQSDEILQCNTQQRDNEAQLAMKFESLQEAEEKYEMLKIAEWKLGRLEEPDDDVLPKLGRIQLQQELMKCKHEIELKAKDLQMSRRLSLIQEEEEFARRTLTEIPWGPPPHESNMERSMNDEDQGAYREALEQQMEKKLAGETGQAIIEELKKSGIEDIQMVHQIVNYIANLPFDCLQFLANSPVELLHNLCRVDTRQILCMSAAIPELNNLMQKIDLDDLIPLLKAAGVDTFHSLATHFAVNPGLSSHMRVILSQMF